MLSRSDSYYSKASMRTLVKVRSSWQMFGAEVKSLGLGLPVLWRGLLWFSVWKV